MRLTLEGDDQFRAFLKSRPQVAVRELAGTLREEAEVIMTRSKREFVPVDTGALRGSGHVESPKTSDTEASVTLGYGGVASAYALIQHERTDFNHPGQGQAKYLEQPVLEAHKGFAQRLAARLKYRIERGY